MSALLSFAALHCICVVLWVVSSFAFNIRMSCSKQSNQFRIHLNLTCLNYVCMFDAWRTRCPGVGKPN